MFVWCYFKNNKCIKTQIESGSSKLSPMDVMILKANSVTRVLCDIPNNFDPKGKTNEELRQYLR